MNLSDLKFKITYRSNNPEDIIYNFYIPALSKAIEYKRAVGFFSSSSLNSIAAGLDQLILNGGKMKLIISQRLSKEDANAIEQGYLTRTTLIEKNLLKEFKGDNTPHECERYNYLAHLIANNNLDIKVALVETYNQKGMYHEKIGIMKDAEGNSVGFSGSLNESDFAYNINFESIDVYCSWKDKSDLDRVTQRNIDFDDMWENKTNKLRIYNFPEAVKNKILEYRKDEIIQEKEFSKDISCIKDSYDRIDFPKWFKPRDYQIEAINSWENNNFRGLLNMATGTGKTLTALTGVKRVDDYLNEKPLFIVIVCPYTHLVEQWKEDVIEFGFEPIICYSDYKYSNWKEMISKELYEIDLGIRKYSCIITTNSTYKTKKFQEEINKKIENFLLVVDEAHNAGAEHFSKYLSENAKYRLALSATPQRHNDEEGSQKIINYFGEEVYEFSLERAIEEGFLTKYYYYPQIVYLTDSERKEYLDITKKLAKFMRSNGKLDINNTVEMLLIKRARIIAGASNKISRLRDLMEDKTKTNYNLIYCGATSTINSDCEGEGEEVIRQIEAVCRLLGNELDMKIAKFTSEESMVERERIIKNFSDGTALQGIVAIKCLDEGVNIPAIRNAYILASSTNPREFIQRRGRVLRKYPGKKYAYIYDFITLPRDIGDIYSASSEELKSDLSIVKKELDRAKEFANLAENKHRALKVIKDVTDNYDNIII